MTSKLQLYGCPVGIEDIFGLPLAEKSSSNENKYHEYPKIKNGHSK